MPQVREAVNWAAKVDTEHPAIRKGLRARGWSAKDIHRQKGGCPDLLVGAFGWLVVVIEVKSPGGSLNDAEVKWAQDWRGYPVIVAKTLDEAVAGVYAARDEIIRRALVAA